MTSSPTKSRIEEDDAAVAKEEQELYRDVVRGRGTAPAQTKRRSRRFVFQACDMVVGCIGGGVSGAHVDKCC